MNKAAAEQKTPEQKTLVKMTAHDLLTRANDLLQEGKHAEAAGLYRGLVCANPDNFAGWMNMCTALRRQKHLDAAIIAGYRALALKPEHAGCLTNLGNALSDASRIGEAVDCQRRAFALAPQDLLVRRNLAIALREAGLFAEAYDHFKTLEKDMPDDANLVWEQALCLLYQGDYAHGWPAFEIRWKLPGMTDRPRTQADWHGEPLQGRRLLITEEQGFGDTLLCTRYLPRVIEDAKQSGGSVTLACKQPLHRLLSRIGGLQLVTPAEAHAAPENYDCQTAMMCLPGIFKTELSNIPAPAPLQAKVDLPPFIAQALKAGEGRLRVGIIWTGSVTFGNNLKRSVDVSRFLPLAHIEGVELYSLQKGPREHDLRTSGMEAVIHEIGPYFEDFAQTAAVLKQLDLVIMTDSSVAHLAGSLGVPVWNLLHDRPYWLYLQDRADSPWYPSMKLYRQPAPGDWDGVFAAVTRDLRDLADKKRQGR